MVLRFVSPLFGKGEAVKTGARLFAINIPVLLYQLFSELLMNGQTLGKKIVGIKVIDTDGREPTWGQYITRWILCLGNLFVYLIPYIIMESPAFLIFFMVLYVPDFLTAIISTKNQRIGDFAAGTVVIDANYRSSIHETIYLEIENKDYKPVFPQVMRLTDRDINGIRNLIDIKRPTKDTEHYMIDVVMKIKTVLGIESDLMPTDFLQQLLRDYNYYTANPGGKSSTGDAHR